MPEPSETNPLATEEGAIPEAGGEQTSEPEGEATVPEAGEQEEEPKGLTADDIIERSFQKTATWIGRRDADLLDKIGRMVESRMQGVAATNPNGGQGDGSPGPSGPDIFEDPGAWFEQSMTRWEQQQASQYRQFNDTTIRHAAKIMEMEPLCKDPEFGKKVVQEIYDIFGQVNRKLPPEAAADSLVKTAITNVVRSKLPGQPTNALSKNSPTNVPLGTLSGDSAKTKTPPAQKVEISDLAQQYAAKWGYSNEDLQKVFGTTGKAKKK